jgi:hypothetical protein
MRSLVVAVLILGTAACGDAKTPGQAFDVQTMANLRKAEVAANVAFSETNDFSQLTSNNLLANEPSLIFSGYGIASTKPTEISFNVTGPTTLYMAAKSAAGNCYYLRIDPTQVPASTQSKARGATCSANDQVAYTADAWR